MDDPLLDEGRRGIWHAWLAAPRHYAKREERTGLNEAQPAHVARRIEVSVPGALRPTGEQGRSGAIG